MEPAWIKNKQKDQTHGFVRIPVWILGVTLKCWHTVEPSWDELLQLFFSFTFLIVYSYLCWLGVKHKFTYLLTLLTFAVLNCLLVLFIVNFNWPKRPKINKSFYHDAFIMNNKVLLYSVDFILPLETFPWEAWAAFLSERQPCYQHYYTVASVVDFFYFCQGNTFQLLWDQLVCLSVSLCDQITAQTEI